MEEVEQKELRGDGTIPVISIEAENLAEATYKTIIACYDHGMRVETPKHRKGMTLGFDADITVRVSEPLSQPSVCLPGIHDDGRGLIQYILEVTHGIHNHWKKNSEHPEWWGYTYNERIVDQIPFVLKRIKHDWDERGRITGRDYQFTTWRAGEDIILEQDDPPCWQRGQLRFAHNKEGELVMSYVTDWRSRDLLKAWNENNLGQTALQVYLAEKVSNMLGVPVKIGAYIDRSSSLHLYGLYFDRDGLAKQIERMKATPYEKISCSLDEYLDRTEGADAGALMRLVAAQSDAESKGHGLNQPKESLVKLGYNVDNYPIPSDWTSWPKSWDAEPDPSKLARVVK